MSASSRRAPWSLSSRRWAAASSKLVYVSSGLVAALLAYANDARIPPTGFLFRSRQGEGIPMKRQNVWQIHTRLTNAERRYADRVSW